MKYKSTDYMYQVTNPIITENIQKSMRERIFHYTNLDALLSILKNKYLKFNRIDNVNDQTEKLFINDQEIINQVFLSCFTHRKSEYIPHWFMYSRDVYGVRLAIYKKADCLTTDCLIDYDKPVHAFKNGEKIDELAAIRNSTEFYSKLSIDFKSIDVIYDEKFAKGNPIIRSRNDGGYIIDLTTLGTVKSDAWKFEDETRMIAQLRFLDDSVTLNEYDYLLVPIHFDNVDKIEVTCGPWMTETLKEVVKDICSTYLGGIKFEVRNSRFDKIIRR